MVVLIGWIGRVISGAWMMMAGAVGFAARAAGRGARELEPHHRRDGLGLLTLGVAVVLAGGLWMRMNNAAGHSIRQVVTGGFGSLAFLAPALIALLAWRLLRHPDRNQATRRAALGWAALLLGLTGLLEIAKGAPRPSAGAQVIRQAGGYIGYGTGGPLAHVLTPWVAGPLLALLALFGLLLITGTPLHAVPGRLSWLRVVFGHQVAPEATGEDGLEIDEDYESGTGIRGRGVRGQIAKNIRLRPAVEGGERVKPYDTPLLGTGRKRGDPAKAVTGPLPDGEAGLIEALGFGAHEGSRPAAASPVAETAEMPVDLGAPAHAKAAEPAAPPEAPAEQLMLTGATLGG